MTTLRPFFPYFGSKWSLARYYEAPRHALVVEPFAGSAGYATFYGSPRVALFDADPIVIGTWRYLLAATPAEISALPEMPEVGDSVDNYRIPQEAKWLIGFWLNRASAQPKKSRTAYSARTDRSQLNWGARAKARIVRQLPAIVGWTATCSPYTSAPNVEATWFVDPPYGDKGKFYRVPFASYETLGAWCLRAKGQVIVCEGPGAAWLPFEPLGSFKSTRGRALEFCWTTGGV